MLLASRNLMSALVGLLHSFCFTLKQVEQVFFAFLHYKQWNTILFLLFLLREISCFDCLIFHPSILPTFQTILPTFSAVFLSSSHTSAHSSCIFAWIFLLISLSCSTTPHFFLNSSVHRVVFHTFLCPNLFYEWKIQQELVHTPKTILMYNNNTKQITAVKWGSQTIKQFLYLTSE